MSSPAPEIAGAPPRGPEAVLREILIVARYEIVSLIVSVRALLFVVAYGVVAGAVGAFYLWMDRQTNGQLENLSKKAGELAATEKAELVEKLGSQVGRPLAEAILNGDLPPMVLAILLLSTFAIPGLVLLVGYSGIADDVATRFSRYVLQRVPRSSWLVGKILGHFAVSYAAIVLVHLLLLAYGTTVSNFDLDKTLPALPRIWLALAFFVLGYVSFTALWSAVVSPPFAAFAVGAMALFGGWIVSFTPIGRVWMGTWHMQLWALDPAAVAVYLGSALVFAGLAYVGLQRRDV